MNKIPCEKCGALILPTTAESTGGVCMACKQGIRESMEASRAYYQKLKEYDPFRELWVSMVKRSSANRKLDGWSTEEKVYFSVCLMEGDVFNGGFEQYFTNSSGDYYSLALDGLERMKAVQSARLLADAASFLVGNDCPPDSQSERWRVTNSKVRRLSELVTRHHRSTRLERLDKRFYEDPDQLADRLAEYAEDNGLVPRF
jgi:DNA-directed RNA polymerase subunit M/transcription elongation factor TFIIS